MITPRLDQARAAQQAAPTVTRHGVLLSILGLGVLLTGPSGVGKSELALDLIACGHALVADDAVQLARWAPGVVVGSAAPLLRGFLEARGLGLLDIGRLYGEAALLDQERLDLVIELGDTALVRYSGEERLHGRRSTRTLLGEAIPQIALARGLAQNLAPVVEAACRDHWLRLSGYAADAAFEARQQAAIDAHSSPQRPPPPA